MFSGGSIVIQTGDTEPVEIQLFDTLGLALLSKTNIKVQVRRQQDDYYLDWSDNYFKTAPSVTQMYTSLEEISPSLNPGLYRLNTAPHVRGLNTAAFVNPLANSIYDITVIEDGSFDAVGLPAGFELKVGYYVDQIAALPPNVADAVWNEMQLDHMVTGSFGDTLRRIVALQKENYFIDNMVYNTQGLLLSGRIRLFMTKTEALAASAGGSTEGEFATYSFTTTPVTGRPERANTARSVRDS